MSEENVEIMRRGVDAFNRGDFAGMVSDFAPEFEYIPSGTIPGATGVYRGPQGFERFMHTLWDEFDKAHIGIHELIEAGDHVLLPATLSGRGTHSGVEVRWDIWQVWTLRDGKVVRGQGFTDRAEALEAAGLSE